MDTVARTLHEPPTAPSRKPSRQLGRRQGLWPWILGGPLSASQSESATPSRTETVRVPITTARAEIQLVTNMGRLELGANSSGRLLDGTLALGPNDRLDRTLSRRGDTRVVRLAAKQVRPDFGLSDALSGRDAHRTIDLSPNVPLTLKVETGVRGSTLDLGGLKVTNVPLHGGVGQTTITLPAAGIVIATIESDIGDITVRLPRGVQAQIRAKSDIGSVQLLGDFQRAGDTSTTTGYASAHTRVDLHVTTSVRKITVAQVGH